jgi:hypothetical protein
VALPRSFHALLKAVVRTGLALRHVRPLRFPWQAHARTFNGVRTRIGKGLHWIGLRRVRYTGEPCFLFSSHRHCKSEHRSSDLGTKRSRVRLNLSAGFACIPPSRAHKLEVSVPVKLASAQNCETWILKIRAPTGFKLDVITGTLLAAGVVDPRAAVSDRGYTVFPIQLTEKRSAGETLQRGTSERNPVRYLSFCL